MSDCVSFDVVWGILVLVLVTTLSTVVVGPCCVVVLGRGEGELQDELREPVLVTEE